MQSTRKYELSYLKVIVNNPTYMVSLDLKEALICENTFYQNKDTIILSMPVRLHSRYELDIPMKLSMSGNIRYRVEIVRLLDFLGFVEVRRKIDIKAETLVLPASEEEYKGSMSDISEGMTEVEETKKRGYDFSDVTDVREYIPGDKLMNIHWKLSAKRDVLMVKERESMSNEQMALFVSLDGYKENIESVVCLSYALVKRLIRENVVVRLIWWNEDLGEFECRRLLELEELDEAFADMYNVHIYENSEDVLRHFPGIFPELRAFVKVGYMEGEAGVEIRELM
jgi:hypothetical protein